VKIAPIIFILVQPNHIGVVKINIKMRVIMKIIKIIIPKFIKHYEIMEAGKIGI
tara:strand:+ start:105 stop:266 length:162 start_codon:yes stop_codon:yes gene_type:complete